MHEPVIPAPLPRRLGAALYDGLLLVAIWMIAAFVDATVRSMFDLPYSPGSMRALMFLSGLLFFGWFWTHGGQTLGMRVWRLKVRRLDGQALTWPIACGRYGAAWLAWLPFAAGVLWCAIDRQRRSWNDMLSATEVVLLPKATEQAPLAPEPSPRGEP